MKCAICGGDAWEDVDQYRFRKWGMILCKKCGFVTYKNIPERPKRFSPVYRELAKDERAFYFQAVILKELFESWIKNKQNFSVYEIGSDTGYFLNKIKNNTLNPHGIFNGLKESLGGCSEYLCDRRNVYRETGIEIDPEFKSGKYDLIISWHKETEHLDIRERLNKYKASLSPNGKLLLGVNVFFDQLVCESGMFDLESYYCPCTPNSPYSPLHLNFWTKDHLRQLFKDIGFKIDKENYDYIGGTYLLSVGESKDEIVLNSDSVIEKLDKIKKLSDLVLENKFKECVELWPNNPSAIHGCYEIGRAQFHKQGIETTKKFIDDSLKATYNHYSIHQMAGDIFFRYDLFDDAIDHFNKVLEKIPENPNALIAISNCYRAKANINQDVNEKIRFMLLAREYGLRLIQADSGSRSNAITWLFTDNARIPTPSEIISANSNKSPIII